MAVLLTMRDSTRPELRRMSFTCRCSRNAKWKWNARGVTAPYCRRAKSDSREISSGGFTAKSAWRFASSGEWCQSARNSRVVSGGVCFIE